MPDDIDGALLARYISGQCSADEATAVRQWVEAEPDGGTTRAQLLAELQAIWAASGRAPYEWGVDDGWRAFGMARDAKRDNNPRASFRVIRAGSVPTAPRPPATGGRGAIVRWVAAAAAILVLAGSPLTWWRLAGRHPQGSVVAANAMTEVTTVPGQRATLRLTDGTQVTLGAASRLRYARVFGETTRDVYLEGDGYFEVVHDSTRPFAVHTARAVVRDIGTTFAVHAYANAAATEVVVRDGIVAFNAGAPSSAPGVVLRAADLGRLDADGRMTTVHDADVASYLAWTTGRLAFRNASLRDVADALGRWYDIDVRLPDSAIGTRRITATFTNESLSIVLERIALSLDVRVEQHGRTVILRPRQHARVAP
jgi:transmembrane sensor